MKTLVVSTLVFVLGLPSSLRAQCNAWAEGFQDSFYGGIDQSVRVLIPFDDGTGPVLFVGGSFYGGPHGGPSVTRWDGAQWLATPSPGSFANAAVVHDDGTRSALYMATNSAEVGRWNGSGWTQLPEGYWNGAEDQSYFFAIESYDDGSGPKLHVGGWMANFDFTFVVWDGSSWIEPVPTWFGDVYALEVFSAQAGAPLLYIGTSSGTGGHGLWTWDGATRTAVPDLQGYVYALQVWDDGSGSKLFVGGSFSSAGGSPAQNIVAWDGTSWSDVGGGVNGEVRSLAVFDDGSGPALHVGGRFDVAGTVPASRVARWDGTSWTALGAGVDGQGHPFLQVVQALASFDDGSGAGPALFAGGDFDTAGDIPSVNFAKWFPTHAPGCPDATGMTFCFGDGTGTPCPCGNVGAPGHGCDNPVATGGVRLELSTFAPNGVGGGQAELLGTGFPATSQPTTILIVSTSQQNGGAGSPLMDGLLCIAPPVLRVTSAAASGGSALLEVDHTAWPGRFFYQLWYRSNPDTFCTPAAANLSSGLEVLWP